MSTYLPAIVARAAGLDAPPRESPASPMLTAAAERVSANVDDLGLRVAMRNLNRPDVADLLPAAARRKFVQLRDHVDGLRGALDRAQTQRDEIQTDRQHWQAALRRYKTPQWAGTPGCDSTGALSDESPQVVEARAKVESLDRAFEHQVQITARRAEEWQQGSRLLVHVEDFLRGLRIPPAPFTGEVAIKTKGNLADQIEGRRRRIRELASDRATAEVAPKPSADAKAAVRAEIERLAETGRPDLGYHIDPADEPPAIHWPTTTLTLSARTFSASGPDGAGMVQVPVVDTPALLAWMFRDRMIEAAMAEIDACTDDRHALSDAARAERLAEIDRDLLATEREEEALVELIEAQGVTIQRRPDADPRAVLNLE